MKVELAVKIGNQLNKYFRVICWVNGFQLDFEFHGILSLGVVRLQTAWQIGANIRGIIGFSGCLRVSCQVQVVKPRAVPAEAALRLVHDNCDGQTSPQPLWGHL